MTNLVGQHNRWVNSLLTDQRLPRPATDKRERLIAAAIDSFHRQGFANTSIAEVARKAEIAPGNVFYYFRTKEDLAAAVVERWTELVSGYVGQLSAEPDPWRRIELFIEQAGLLRQMYVSLGCPLAAITRDVRQDAPTLAVQAEGVYAVQFRWLEAQFMSASLGADEARLHSRFLMATYHGAIGLAYAQNDETLITDVVDALKSWLVKLRR